MIKFNTEGVHSTPKVLLFNYKVVVLKISREIISIPTELSKRIDIIVERTWGHVNKN